MLDRSFCPRCGGKDIKYVWTNAAAVRLGAPLPRRCGDCGYTAMFFPVDDEGEEELARDKADWDYAILYGVMVLLFLAALYMLLR